MYQKGRIYKLVDNTNGNFYIGSTCSALSRRLCQHVCSAKRYENDKQKTRQCSSRVIIQNNDYQMILIQSYPCNTKEELVAKEYEIIQANAKCVNKVRGLYQKPQIYSKQTRERRKADDKMRKRWRRSFGGEGLHTTNLWHIDTTLFD